MIRRYHGIPSVAKLREFYAGVAHARRHDSPPSATTGPAHQLVDEGARIVDGDQGALRARAILKGLRRGRELNGDDR